MSLNSAILWIEGRKRLWLQIGLLVLGLCAAGLMAWSTAKHGIGVRSDSVDYVWAAQTLASRGSLGRLGGEGAFKPMTQFPPLYSISLAALEFVGVGAWEGARWLASLFFALNIVLIGLAVYRLTSSTAFALAAGTFALIAPAVFEVNLWAMTEAPFTTFVLLGFLLLDDYFRKDKLRLLIWAAVFLALAFLTRYVGATAVGAAGLVLLLRPGKKWLDKVKEAAILGAISALPVAAWMVRNSLLTGSAANKIINYHPITAQKWAVFKNTVAGWVSPLHNIFVIGKRKLAVLLGLGALGFLYSHSRQLTKRSKPKQGSLLGWLLLVYVAAYIPLVFFSVMFTGAAIPLDDRMMYPVYIALIVALFYLLEFLWRRSWQIAPALAITVLVLFGFAGYTLTESNASDTVALATESREHGKGYALEKLAETDVVQTLLSFPDDYVIYTDNVHQLYYFSGRLAYLFPVALDTATQLETAGFANTLQNIQKRIAAGQRIMFVFFFPEELDHTLLERYFPTMRLVVGGKDGYLYVSQ